MEVDFMENPMKPPLSLDGFMENRKRMMNEGGPIVGNLQINIIDCTRKWFKIMLKNTVDYILLSI